MTKDNHAEIAKMEAAGAKVERDRDVVVAMYDSEGRTWTPPRVESSINAARRGS